MDVIAVFIAAVGTVAALWGLQRGEFKGLRGDMGKLETGLRGEMTELRSELRGEMNDLRTDLKGEMGGLRTEVRTDLRALGEKVDRVFLELLHHVQQGHPHGPPNQAA